MKVTTNVTIEVKDEKGRRMLAPGEHNLADAIAQELIEGGYAEAIGKGSKAASNPDGGQGQGRPLLQNPIPVIVEGLGKLNAEELDALFKEESDKGDKARKGVLDAIEAAKAELQK